MRSVILAAGLFAVLGLSACDSSKTDDAKAAAAAPAAPRYFGRSQQLYAGQEMIDKVDTATVKVTGPDAIEITLKKDGKEFAHMVDTVSADGNTLTTRFRNHLGNQELTGTSAERRVAAAPAGSHPVSGSWQQQSFDASDAVRAIQYKMTADGFQMSWAGQSYDARFDGKEYPVNADPGKTTVVLKKIDPRTVEETDHRDGKIVDEFRMTVAADGRTISVRDKDLTHEQTTTYTLQKQP